LCPSWLKALTSACRVRHHQTICHGFPAVALTDVRQARAAGPIDALPALVAARTADAPAQVVVAACTCYVPAAAAEQA
jgi:hypothetical protein